MKNLSYHIYYSEEYKIYEKKLIDILVEKTVSEIINNLAIRNDL